MFKKWLLLIVLTYSSLFSYSEINNLVIPKEGDLVSISVTCTDDECSTVKDTKLKAIAGLKSTKSWARIFKNGVILKYVSTNRISDTKCIVTFIICNSYDSKIYDSSFGIEILYKDR